MLLLEPIISIIAPHNCICCGNEGKLICSWCLPEAFSKIPSRCYRCYATLMDYKTCNKCRKVWRPKNVWVVAEYELCAKELIKKLKFARAKQAANIIAEEIDTTLPQLDKKTIIAHIPTATSRRRQRGYDQSELIAKSLARRRGMRHATLLFRQGQSRQVGSDRKKRQNQLNESFRFKAGVSHVESILLIDDLLTTGATIEAATRVVKGAGVKKVYAAVFAQRSV